MAVLMGAVTNTLCKERKRAETRHSALSEFLVMKNGAVNPRHEMMQQRPENADTLVGKHNRGLRRLRKKLVELNMLKYMPRDEEIVENLKLSTRPELRKEIERQLLEDNIQKDSVEDDWDFMTNRMYLAEERLEEETKMWSGSTQPTTDKSSNWCPLHETSGHDASECRGLGKGSTKGKGGKGGKGGKQKGKGSKGKHSDSEGCWTCGSSSHQQRDCPKNGNQNNPGKEEGDRPNAWGRSLTIEEISAAGIRNSSQQADEGC